MRLHLSFPLACVLLLAATIQCTAQPAGIKNPEPANFVAAPQPVLFGVETTFDIDPAHIAPMDKVRVTLMMKNKRPTAVRFKYSGCIQEHIELFDAAGKKLTWKPGLPIPECPHIEIDIPAGQTVQKTVVFCFGDFYVMPVGDYTVGLKYDRRLMDANVAGDPWTPWSNTKRKLRVK